MKYIKNRLDKLENRYNPDTHRPIVICWNNNEPQFRDKPETKKQAIVWLKARATESRRTDAKDLVIMPEGESVPAIEDYIIQKFNIDPTKEL